MTIGAWPYVLMALGEVSIASAVVVTSTLRFARCVIERADRIDAEEAAEIAPLSAEVAKMKRDTLVKERELRVAKMRRLIEHSFPAQAADEEEAIARIDAELVRLERYKEVPDWRHPWIEP